MILHELTLENFGVYFGKQSINLLPPDSSKPVVLFGGLNGRGKTTLLDAFLLVLYGNNANLSTKDKSYSKLLKKYIHQSKLNQCEHASISLRFSIIVDSETEVFEIKRSWAIDGDKTPETVTVRRNDRVNKVLSDTWKDVVEEFLPHRIASLFFFDGERIENMANADHAPLLLKSGVQSLLGLDLIEKLNIDLRELENRKIKESSKDSHSLTLTKEAEALQNLETIIEDLSYQIGDKQNSADKLQLKWEAVEKEFIEVGGDLYEKQQTIIEQRDQFKENLGNTTNDAIRLSSGSLPLNLIQDQLTQLSKTLNIESESIQAENELSLFENRDQKVSDLLRSLNAGQSVISSVSSLFKSENSILRKKVTTDVVFNASKLSQEQIDNLLQVELSEEIQTSNSILSRFHKITDELEILDKKLAKVPHKTVLKEVLSKRQTLRHELDLVKLELDALKEQKDVNIVNQEKLITTIENIKLKHLAEMNKEADNQKIISDSLKVRQLLLLFKDEVLQSNLVELQNQILTSFNTLTGKSKLINEIVITPNSFDLKLYNENHQLISFDSLSAGERQLLATSMLWGLKKSANQQVPTIIDTPLGRLDSIHRNLLVTKYFPYASHQVILLSTDEEIKGETLKDLSPYIGHSYCLKFNEQKASTYVEPGYFEGN